jgi:hypothetical protein
VITGVLLAQRLDLVGRRSARLTHDFLGPGVVEAPGDALTAALRGARLSAPRRPPSAVRICSSAGWCLRVRRRMSRTPRTAVCVAEPAATMAGVQDL